MVEVLLVLNMTIKSLLKQIVVPLPGVAFTLYSLSS